MTLSSLVFLCLCHSTLSLSLPCSLSLSLLSSPPPSLSLLLPSFIHPRSHLLSLPLVCCLSLPYSSCPSLVVCLSHAMAPSLTRPLTHCLSHSLPHSLSLSLVVSLSHSLSLSLSLVVSLTRNVVSPTRALSLSSLLVVSLTLFPSPSHAMAPFLTLPLSRLLSARPDQCCKGFMVNAIVNTSLVRCRLRLVGYLPQSRASGADRAPARQMLDFMTRRCRATHRGLQPNLKRLACELYTQGIRML